MLVRFQWDVNNAAPMTPNGGQAMATGYKRNLYFYCGPTHGTYDPPEVSANARVCLSVRARMREKRLNSWKLFSACTVSVCTVGPLYRFTMCNETRSLHNPTA